MTTIRFESVSMAYPGGGPPALRGVDLQVAAGDLVVVTGASGSGKSTLLRCIPGLVPHSSGGRFRGDVVVGGRSVRDRRPRDLAGTVGFVHQDPEAQFVADRVETDVAFALENLGLDPVAMRRRVEDALDAVGVAHLRHRTPGSLSGGEQQRCAIAGVLAAAPEVLVLDEPTSQLDPQSATDVLAAVGRLNADLGTTTVLAEHRLERAAPAADRVLVVAGGQVTADGDPGAVLAAYPGAPPVTHLGHLLGWDPAPLTVKQARRRLDRDGRPPLDPGPPPPPATPGSTLVAARGASLRLAGRTLVAPTDVEVAEGEVVALLGRNGAGKTSLLRLLAGLVAPAAGRVERAAATAYVPQDPGALLFQPTARQEVAHTLDLLGRADPVAVDTWLGRLHLDDVADRHPRSLSTGQRQRLAVAAVAVGGAPVLLLDEPTRGMDDESRRALAEAVAVHAAGGGAVVLATHDTELAAAVATRAVVLGEGDVVADGDARSVLAGSLFAPQVLRVLPPFLTVDEVARALHRQREVG